MADNTTASKDNILRWSVFGLAIAVIVIPTVIFIVWHGYSSFGHRYSELTRQISEQTGLNLYLIKALAAVLALPLVFGTKYLYSLSSKRRQIGIALIALFTVLYNLGLYGLTRGANFSFQSGKPSRYYAVTSKGVRYSDRPGVEPEFGIPFQQVTPEKVLYLEKLDGSTLTLQDPSKANWFNSITGDPELWYSQLPDGTMRFFNKPGYDPMTGTALQEVSKDFRAHWLAARAAVRGYKQKQHEVTSPAAKVNVEADRAKAELALLQERQAAEKLEAALPPWRAAENRLKSELLFWTRMRNELSASGNSLRPEIESALQLAQSTESDCQRSYSQGDGDALQACAKSLNTVLDRIVAFKN